MKTLNIIGLAAMTATVSLLCGCVNTDLSPIPETSSVLVGMTIECNKPELAKKGAKKDMEFMEELVRLYTNAKYNYYLEDRTATLANVKSCMLNAVQSELAIIYFTCKATQVKAAEGDTSEPDGLDEALVLYDGLLLDNDIWNIIKGAKGRVFMVFDTGTSETMFRSAAAKNGVKAERISDIVSSEALTHGGQSVLVWSACADGETQEGRSVGSRLTNILYFYAHSHTYDEVKAIIDKKINGRQGFHQTVIGTGFGDKTFLR